MRMGADLHKYPNSRMAYCTADRGSDAIQHGWPDRQICYAALPSLRLKLDSMLDTKRRLARSVAVGRHRVMLAIHILA
jgi:hypothetical protein